MLEKLLQYHQNLASPEFVENLINRINHAFRLRNMILAATSILGLIAGIVGIIKLWPNSDKMYLSSLNLQGFGEYQLLLASLSIVGLLTFITWLFNDEFERP